MSMFSKRPAALAHISDEAAARALSKHFGNFVEAAKDLGVDRKDLGRLTWSNPAILDAAHDRMSLFIFIQQGEIIHGLTSKSASVRRRAADRMGANPMLFRDFNPSLFALLTPATRGRKGRGPNHSAAVVDEAWVARERLDQEAAAEVAFEREQEREQEREREREQEREQEREREREREREQAEVAVMRRPVAAPVATVSLWPSSIRRPRRGMRR